MVGLWAQVVIPSFLHGSYIQNSGPDASSARDLFPTTSPAVGPEFSFKEHISISSIPFRTLEFQEGSQGRVCIIHLGN
jgi:hypothetical protein